MTNDTRRLVFAAAASLMLVACAKSKAPADAGPPEAGVHDAGDAGGGPSCMARKDQAWSAVQQALEAADTSCTRAGDCEQISIDTDCQLSCGAVVATRGKAAIEAVVAEQNATTCAGFEASGCDHFAPPCIPPPPVGCVSGRCAYRVDDVPDAGDADGCLEQTIRWGENGGLVALHVVYRVEPCRAFRAEQLQAGMPPQQICDNQVPEDAAVTVDDVDALVASEDVQAAIARAPVVFGIDARGVDGTVFRIEIGTAIIDVGAACAASVSCEPIPAGVEALRQALDALRIQARNAPPNCQNTI